MSYLNEEKDLLAQELFGKGFIKLPRFVGDQAFGKNRAKSMRGLLLLALINLCRYTDGYVVLNERKINCRPGEYVGTHSDLSQRTGIAIGSVARLLKRLARENLIEVTVLEGGSRIRVSGYSQFILPKEDEKAGPAQPLDEAAKKTIMRKEDTDRNDKTPFF